MQEIQNVCTHRVTLVARVSHPTGATSKASVLSMHRTNSHKTAVCACQSDEINVQIFVYVYSMAMLLSIHKSFARNCIDILTETTHQLTTNMQRT